MGDEAGEYPRRVLNEGDVTRFMLGNDASASGCEHWMRAWKDPEQRALRQGSSLFLLWSTSPRLQESWILQNDICKWSEPLDQVAGPRVCRNGFASSRVQGGDGYRGKENKNKAAQESSSMTWSNLYL